MGSFNVACSVSKISIGCGTDVVFFPLEISKYPYKIGDGNNTLIYPWCFYSPATLPIFGKYDDYGGIDNVIRDENVEYIENYFQCKIDDITGIENRPGSISSGMFVHRKIYDFMIKSNISDYDGKRRKLRNNLYPEYDSFRQQLIKAKKDNEEMNQFWKEQGQEDRIKNDGFGWIQRDYHYFNFRDFGIFQNIYRPCVFNGLFKNELIDMIIFNQSMFDINSFYFPAMNGEQFGNYYASQKLYKESLKIVNKEVWESRIYDIQYKFRSMKYKIKCKIRKFFKKKK